MLSSSCHLTWNFPNCLCLLWTNFWCEFASLGYGRGDFQTNCFSCFEGQDKAFPLLGWKALIYIFSAETWQSDSSSRWYRVGQERQSPSRNGHSNAIPSQRVTTRQVLTSEKSHFHMLDEQSLRGDKEKKAEIERESTKDLQRRQQILGNSGRQRQRLTGWCQHSRGAHTQSEDHLTVSLGRMRKPGRWTMRGSAGWTLMEEGVDEITFYGHIRSVHDWCTEWCRSSQHGKSNAPQTPHQTPNFLVWWEMGDVLWSVSVPDVSPQHAW